jgi:hypothetical protein
MMCGGGSSFKQGNRLATKGEQARHQGSSTGLESTLDSTRLDWDQNYIHTLVRCDGQLRRVCSVLTKEGPSGLL